VTPGRAALLPLILLCLVACTEAPDPVEPAPVYERIVTLAPNLAELVHAAGAGRALVGVSAYSDYPPQVQELTVIGDAFMIDHEQLALLRPDLLLVWQGGTPAHVVDELRSIGYNVEAIRTNSLNDVAEAILRIGALTGHDGVAQQSVASYRTEFDAWPHALVSGTTLACSTRYRGDRCLR
jgi:ABC-type hemin transport system substrate-binding protein